MKVEWKLLNIKLIKKLWKSKSKMYVDQKVCAYLTRYYSPHFELIIYLQVPGTQCCP